MEQRVIKDCHVHCYPDEVVRDPVTWAQSRNEQHWENLVTTGPQGWAGPEDLLRAMDRDGIEQVLLQAWYWENPESCNMQNEWHADWISRYPGRFIACAAIHPEMQHPVAELEAAKSWGACAVGECLPCLQTEAGWAHESWQGILNWTTDAGWPVAMHVTEPVGHDYPGRVETPLMELVELFENHPGQKWLCAHWGGGLPFYSLNKRVHKAIGNVWFDSAAGPLLYDSRIWKTACDAVGPERILFGSDFPLLLYPRVSREPGWSRIIQELMGSGLGNDAIEQICSRNWDQLFTPA
ncbi:MAG: amidohydrolase family protein [Puniceicoccaceae bacterium]